MEPRIRAPCTRISLSRLFSGSFLRTVGFLSGEIIEDPGLHVQGLHCISNFTDDVIADPASMCEDYFASTPFSAMECLAESVRFVHELLGISL